MQFVQNVWCNEVISKLLCFFILKKKTRLLGLFVILVGLSKKWLETSKKKFVHFFWG